MRVADHAECISNFRVGSGRGVGRGTIRLGNAVLMNVRVRCGRVVR